MGELGTFLKAKYPNGCPGVYLQGLLVFGTDGSIVYENECDPRLARQVIDISRELDVDLICYSRDTILYAKHSYNIDLIPTYKVCLHGSNNGE